MRSDFRYVARSLLRTKGFTIVTVATLALGIGASAAVFSAVDWILFRVSTFPPQVFFVGAKDKRLSIMLHRFDEQVQAYQNEANVFSEVARAVPNTGNVTVGGSVVATEFGGLSANLLPLIGVSPASGRGFLPEEDAVGRNNVVIITHEFWQRHFQGARDVLGKTLELDQLAYSVVGVLRRDQVLPLPLQFGVFRPLAYRPDPEKNRWDGLMMLARLRPGVSREQAEAALAKVTVELGPWIAQYLGDQTPALFAPADLQQLLRPEVYWALLGAVGFLYGIACVNASNLTLVRLLGRKRELSVRLAMGAAPMHLVRLLVIETASVSVLASVIGFAIANWLFPFFLRLADVSPRPGVSLWSLDWRALAFLGGLTVVTSMVIVALPAMRVVRMNIQATLREGGASLGESRRLAQLRGTFVVLQAAFAVVLLTGAGLMVRSINNLQSVDLGFDPSRRVKIELGFPQGHTESKSERLVLLRRLQEHLRRVPGVAAASYGTDNLLPGFYFAESSVAAADGSPIKVSSKFLSPDYRETAGLTLKRGQWFDQTGAGVMINEALARARFGEVDPIGQSLRTIGVDGSGFKAFSVVGVVADVHDTVRSSPGYHIYMPETWYPQGMNTFLVRLTHDSTTVLTDTIRRAIFAFDPKIVTSKIIPLAEVRALQLGPERFALSVLQVLSGLAITLTVVGLFAVITHTVDRRMNEFGLRLALGATPRDLVHLVIRRGLGLTIIGIVLGIIGALILAGALQTLLFETPRYDPLVLGTVTGVLLLSALAASIFPAWRATRASVVRLLRAE